MRKRNSKKTNSEEEKEKETSEREMGQAHDQPGRERPERKKTWKQSNGPGPETIGGCAALVFHRAGWSIDAPVCGCTRKILYIARRGWIGPLAPLPLLWAHLRFL
jgi:hypothetical protein